MPEWVTLPVFGDRVRNAYAGHVTSTPPHQFPVSVHQVLVTHTEPRWGHIVLVAIAVLAVVAVGMYLVRRRRKNAAA